MTLRELVLLLGVLLPASMARAQDYGYYNINVCNSGKLKFDVAVVERELGDWHGYKDWKVSGWYAADPGTSDPEKNCVRWNTRTWENDWTTSRPGVYLVIAFRDSTGVWGQANFNLKGTKLEERATDQEICVKQGWFEYKLPTGKISAKCEAGYKPMRASFFFDPAPGGMLPRQMPGMPMTAGPGPYEFSLELDNDDRAVKFGETAAAESASKASRGSGPSSSSESSLTVGEILGGAAIVAGLAVALTDTPKPFARGTLTASLLGKRIARWADTDSSWYYENGSQVNPTWGLNGKKASWLMDAPDQRPTSDPEVAAAFGSLRQALASSQYNRRTQLESTGRLSYTYIPYDASSEYLTTVNLSALDYKNARPVATDGRGVTGFMIPCKQGQLCVGTLYEGKIKTKDKFYLLYMGEGDAKAENVWRPLMQLVDFYPAEPTITVR